MPAPAAPSTDWMAVRREIPGLSLGVISFGLGLVNNLGNNGWKINSEMTFLPELIAIDPQPNNYIDVLSKEISEDKDEW